MLSFAPAPIFTANWDHHRPAVSSPLSSSPLRASSPLGTQDERADAFSLRQTQSSPIQPPRFKYAARATRPNPVLRRREDAQQQRRATYLRSVRDKAEDKAWQRRDIEGQFLKSNWIADMDRLSHDAPELSEADIEDASSFQPELLRLKEDAQDADMDGGDDDMVDEYAEDAELEAMFASYQQQQQPLSPATRPISPSLSDDEYDDIFEELLSAKDIDQAMQTHQPTDSADQMDME
ncbi:hypothetical protein CCM_00506 [Cordyceps militaris CM01]|uniref:Uncharacterized protein n=1 Tax=Cordyceps militaris (strain CM01) TaxID=983644 RepID=G3J4I2_CORMM|nr:uncharacterized protein CCM_00506 [Cordyceps militaris CM01]EGX95852.1 hypothetical protein CCM_00506 [Cordyceps militaris CM01]